MYIPTAKLKPVGSTLSKKEIPTPTGEESGGEQTGGNHCPFCERVETTIEKEKQHIFLS